MSVKIRLKRIGAKKAPFYRVVVADSRYPRDGRFIEEIGYYNPLTNPVDIKIDSEKAQKWIKNGAQPTETVKSLLKKAGITARAIVDSPEDVVVTVTEESETSISLKLTVAAPDMGKVIGKHGKIAKAIRQLMKAAANGTGKKVTIDIE